MQHNYRYDLTEPMGKNFHPEFKPELTPKQMLRMGVFRGKYMTDCDKEFPEDWLVEARLCHEIHDPQLNFLASMLRNLCLYGVKKAGFMQKIPEAGFNGIAAIIWDEDVLTICAR